MFVKKVGTEEKLKKVIDVMKNEKGTIESFEVEDIGWVSKDEAIALALDEILDAVVVFATRGPYIRTRPDPYFDNNYSAM